MASFALSDWRDHTSEALNFLAICLLSESQVNRCLAGHSFKMTTIAASALRLIFGIPIVISFRRLADMFIV
ncbi:hypothetical protein D3H34_15835 [Acidovorax cavernicola]|uniref:Uncharacterized protein n=1 Tax=Acidovorax cavernicola TaxID=1675792 RepID=A0A9X8D464_9BURK|nr:hypothetical protein D3H34_15835 [Acidovorax cavernicola]